MNIRFILSIPKKGSKENEMNTYLWKLDENTIYGFIVLSKFNFQHSTRVTFNVLKENKSETDISSVKLIRLKERSDYFFLR